MDTVTVPSQTLPVIDRAELCVIGGSCTGVFAAVRAARLGVKTVIVEKQNRFGGVAVSGLVGVWHSLYDINRERQIIAGMTEEVVERLKKRDAVRSEDGKRGNFVLNTAELAIELDELVVENKVKPWLLTAFCAPYWSDGKLAGIIVENKSGRGVILADTFVDASGDGDLCHRSGLATWVGEAPQPPTTCAHLVGLNLPPGLSVSAAVHAHAAAHGFSDSFMWGTTVPGCDTFMLAGTRVLNCDCADAAELTRAELEGRRQVRAILDILRGDCQQDKLVLESLPSMIGVRESRHVKARARLSGDDLLQGVRFEDAIANGTYPVDIHEHGKPGILFRHLDGREDFHCPGQPCVSGRWRPEDTPSPAFYQVPLRCLIPEGAANVVAAGRMLDADQGAFGAVRVMVNLNQTGEAAGVLASLALGSGKGVQDIPAAAVRAALAKGGSSVL